MKTFHPPVAVNLKVIALMFTSLVSLPNYGQQSYTYLFTSSPYTSVQPGGPILEPIGTVITPVPVTIPATTCPDMPVIDVTHFEHNSGFKAKSFFTDHYSIEMIFKFEEVSGYNRIIDFSNSISDNGIYTYFDCLSFYPSGIVGPCPGSFDTTNYKQIVITRNQATKAMNVYVNGSLFTNHIDDTDYYVIGAAPNDSIKFFKDDLSFQNEASPGNVALIRLCDFELSQQEINNSYNDFCNRITSLEDAQMLIEFNIYPNPAKDQLNIQLSNADFSKEIKLRLLNALGQTLYQTKIISEVTGFNLKQIPPGALYYQLQMDDSIVKTGKIIME